MKIRIAVCLVLLGTLLPGRAFATAGIVLLVDDGKPEWNTLVTQLAAAVGKRKPTEVAFRSTNTGVQAAVDRLVECIVSRAEGKQLFDDSFSSSTWAIDQEPADMESPTEMPTRNTSWPTATG